MAPPKKKLSLIEGYILYFMAVGAMTAFTANYLYLLDQWSALRRRCVGRYPATAIHWHKKPNWEHSLRSGDLRNLSCRRGIDFDGFTNFIMYTYLFSMPYASVRGLVSSRGWEPQDCALPACWLDVSLTVHIFYNPHAMRRIIINTIIIIIIIITLTFVARHQSCRLIHDRERVHVGSLVIGRFHVPPPRIPTEPSTSFKQRNSPPGLDTCRNIYQVVLDGPTPSNYNAMQVFSRTKAQAVLRRLGLGWLVQNRLSTNHFYAQLT